MNLRVMGGLTGALAAVLVAGCVEDPTASRAGTPSRIAINPSVLFLDDGATGNITASALDELTTPLPGGLSFSSSAPGVASVAAAGGPPVPNAVSTAVTVTALVPGPAYIRFSGQGLTDSARVNVMPLAFDGAASTTTPQVGRSLTLSSSTLLKFDPASADIDFGGGTHGLILNRTADQLEVIVPQPDATATGPLTVEGIAVSYVPGFLATLPTSTSFSAITSPFGVHTAPDQAGATLTIPADGAADLVFWDGFKTGEPIDYFYPFTLASPDTLTFTLDWVGAADLDMANCTVGCAAFVGGFGAAGTSHPETYTVIFPAGTFNLLVEQFDDHAEPAHLFKVTIRNP